MKTDDKKGKLFPEDFLPKSTPFKERTDLIKNMLNEIDASVFMVATKANDENIQVFVGTNGSIGIEAVATMFHVLKTLTEPKLRVVLKLAIALFEARGEMGTLEQMQKLFTLE